MRHLLYLKRSQLEPVEPLDIERVFQENSKQRAKDLRNLKNHVQKQAAAQKADVEPSVYQ